MFLIMAIINTTRLIVPILLSCLIAPAAFAESGRADYDLDDDGLIEINSLADLDEIRNNLDGTSLYGESTGCPEAGCNGFELTTTLDFDTNADGKMDENDAYWNGGEGWVPIGYDRHPFVGKFDGNNYQINNLYIDSKDIELVGLFGYVGESSAVISHLGLAGKLMSVIGDSYSRSTGAIAGVVDDGALVMFSYSVGSVSGPANVGGLVGVLDSGASIHNSFSLGTVTGSGEMTGGLVASFDSADISESFSTATVNGASPIGGFIGVAYHDATLSNSFSVGLVNPSYIYKGGLIGYAFPDNVIINSYWATDTSGQPTSGGESDIDNYFGATLAELQCPTSSDDTECLMNYTLYPTWDSTIWDFGTSSELPGLIIDGVVYRDGDGDGALDTNHAPEVTFVLTQNGNEVSDITIGDGDVTLEAVITDQDASDHHTLSWTYEDVTVISETDTSVTFSSDNLIVGDYTVSAVVTDNRFPIMSGNAEITFSVEAAPIEPEVVEPNPSPEVTPSSKSSGGGSMNFYWLMLISGFLLVGRRTVYCGITKI
jgi:hypothetical protein